MSTRASYVFLACIALTAATAHAQVTSDRILHADQEPQNWLTYSGTYKSQRYTTLTQVTPATPSPVLLWQRPQFES